MKKREEPHKRSDATKLVKKISRNGDIRLTIHIEERMRKLNIDMQDILNAFKNGKVIKKAAWDNTEQQWKYRFIGNGIDRKNINIITNINKRGNYIVLVTVY